MRAKGIQGRVLLMGAGPEENRVRSLAAQKGLAQEVTILPPGGDVARVLAEEIGVLLLPSEWEGTPRVVVEAQASGVPVLCSTAVSAGVCLVPELFHRLPLADGPAAWAEEVLHLAKVRVPRHRVEDCFARSPLEIENQVEHLMALYMRFVA